VKGQRHHLEGKRFGNLLVVKRDKVDKWECVCDCGRKSKPRGHRLINGISKSCGGCKWKGRAFRQILCEYKSGAKRRGLSWELSAEEFKVLTASPCYYTGRLPSSVRKLGVDTFVYNGIDRKDSDVGYTVENCVPCCSEVNYAKMDMNYSDFIQLCEDVTKTQKIKDSRCLMHS
jgi:hypothetical protein